MTRKKGKCRTGRIPITDFKTENFEKGIFGRGTRVTSVGNERDVSIRQALARGVSALGWNQKPVCWTREE